MYEWEGVRADCLSGHNNALIIDIDCPTPFCMCLDV